jgi:4,5-DOPA dioxygenase extradiol
MFPSYFVSHGAPNLVLTETPAHDFLKGLGSALDGARAVLVISAHFESRPFRVTGSATPQTIYDFGGFAPELYRMHYAAPGAPDLARGIAARLCAAGFPTAATDRHGFDHGVWVPMMLIRPQADLPVVVLSVDPDAGPVPHLAIGRALAPLREEGVTIIGSGALTHNLRAIFAGGLQLDRPEQAFAREFADWVRDRTRDGDVDSLVNYREIAPHGAANHPTEEHFLPFFAALGAGGGRGERIHSSGEYGALMMDVYRFG